MRPALKRIVKALVNVHVRLLVLGVWVTAAIGGIGVSIAFLLFWAACEVLDAVDK